MSLTKSQLPCSITVSMISVARRLIVALERLQHLRREHAHHDLAVARVLRRVHEQHHRTDTGGLARRVHDHHAARVETGRALRRERLPVAREREDVVVLGEHPVAAGLGVGTVVPEDRVFAAEVREPLVRELPLEAVHVVQVDVAEAHLARGHDPNNRTRSTPSAAIGPTAIRCGVRWTASAR